MQDFSSTGEDILGSVEFGLCSQYLRLYRILSSIQRETYQVKSKLQGS